MSGSTIVSALALGVGSALFSGSALAVGSGVSLGVGVTTGVLVGVGCGVTGTTIAWQVLVSSFHTVPAGHPGFGVGVGVGFGSSFFSSFLVTSNVPIESVPCL